MSLHALNTLHFAQEEMEHLQAKLEPAAESAKEIKGA